MTTQPNASSRKRFEQAVSLMQQGSFAAAETLCEELLARSPDDAELAHFGGVLANRMGRYDVAIERLTRCVRIDPGRARSHAALGFAQDAAGLPEAARDSFAAAVHADPRFAEAYNGLGIAASRTGRRDEALASFERAIALNPRLVEARLNLARGLMQFGRSDEAAQQYREALRAAGDHRAVLKQAALGLHGAGDFESAIAGMRRHLAGGPDAEVRGRLAQALDAVGRAGEADREIEGAVADFPGDPELHNVHGTLLQKRGEWGAARAAFEKALALRPRFSGARINLAMALRKLGESEASARELERARGDAANDAEALTTLAMIAGQAGESAQAIALFEQAIALDPAWPRPRGLLGAELLREGRIERGWKEYLYRPARATQMYAAIARGTYPPALPADLRGRRFALLGEQGLGDVLFFLRYAKPLADAGARFHVHADPRLEPLLRRVLPIDDWLPAPQPPAGAEPIWMGDLPLVARPLAGDVAPTLRIAPLAERVERMRSRLPATGRRRIGLAWKAGTPPGEGPAAQQLLSKDVPVESLAHAFAGREVDCIVLQRHPQAQALERFAAVASMHDFSAVNDDLEDMLALLSLLDDYAGVSSTNVHLLAAAGGGGHILVPHPAEWRWQLAGASPWFPQFSVHRQGRDGDWSGALRSLQGELP